MKFKTLYKDGDRRDAYEMGKKVVFKWGGKEWTIISVKYNELKDRTAIKLNYKEK